MTTTPTQETGEQPAKPRAQGGRRQLLFEDVAVGDHAPVFELPLTLQRLVMEAGVNRDFTPLHHDDEDTRLTGAPGSYANTMFIEALLEAMLRTWMGDRGRLCSLSIRMISFNLANTVVSAGGTVTSTAPEPDGGRVELDIWMRSNNMLTVTGTAAITLPASSAIGPPGERTASAEDGRR